MPQLAQGTLLHQRYRIVRPLGKGGMGEVYEAVDLRLRNTVAVKQMTIDVAEANRAFEREARLLAALRHPALPVVIDCFADEGQFLVMQYIEGEDLAHAVRRSGRPFDSDELARCAIALAGALAYLHRHDPPILHRDIKPHNVNRTPAGEYVLLDFGLATTHRSSDSTVASDTRSLYGYTPQYSPPEQIDGLPTDGRSDIFSLGATLFHLAAAAPPPTALERHAAIGSGAPDPLVARLLAVRNLDPTVHAVIARALALDPRDRFQFASEMLAALDEREAAARRPAAATPAPEVSPERRRVDAALPASAEVGRAIDLIVQVRFEASPVLGLEDWPSRRKPDRIEQVSESLDVTYPADPKTGERLPARLRVRIVAPDFSAAGSTEQLVDVPPRDYSKRLAFLLTPLRAGCCRVNVEVYALDAAFLGVLAIEAEAFVESGVSAPELRVANLNLRLAVGREAHDLAHIGPTRLDGASRDEMRARLAPPPPQIVVAAPAGPPDEAVASIESSSFRRQAIAAAAAMVVLIGVGITMLRPPVASVPTAPPASASAQGTPAASVNPIPAGPPPPSSLPGAPSGGTAPIGGAARPAPPPALPQPEIGRLAPELKPANPRISDEAYAKNAIRAVLTELCNAYERLSPEAVQQVFPKVNIIALRLQLNASRYKAVSCSFGEPTIKTLDPVGGSAAIQVEIQRVFEHAALDPKPDVEDVIADLTLVRASARGRWVIDKARYRPRPKRK